MTPDHDVDSDFEHLYPPRKWGDPMGKPFDEERAPRMDATSRAAAEIDRLHTAEARCAILEAERRATWEAMRLILTRNSDDTGRTYDELLLWLDANRPHAEGGKQVTLATKCPHCGAQHAAPEASAELERLTQALAECQERALRTMAAQQQEIENLRTQNDELRATLAMANATINELWPQYAPRDQQGELLP